MPLWKPGSGNTRRITTNPISMSLLSDERRDFTIQLDRYLLQKFPIRIPEIWVRKTPQGILFNSEVGLQGQNLSCLHIVPFSAANCIHLNLIGEVNVPRRLTQRQSSERCLRK